MLPLAADVYGSAPSPFSIALLHGFPLDRRVWREVAQALSPAFRVINLDLPGFGGSAYDAAFSMEDLARLVRSHLQREGLLPCLMAGLSMGGYVTLAYHRTFPQDLVGLALVDSRAEADAPEARETRNRMAEVALREGAPAVAKLMLPRMLARAPGENPPEVESRLLEIMHACPPQTLARACAAMRDRPDYRTDVRTTHLPLLVICGEADAITPPGPAWLLAESARRGRFVQIPRAGHMTPMEAPRETAAALAEFAHSIRG